MRKSNFLSRAVAAAGLATGIYSASAVAHEHPLIWSIDAERLEYRFGGDEDVLAWEFDFNAGSDELKFVWRSEGEFGLEAEAFETLENQALLQFPVLPFFDAFAGVRVDTPNGPDRFHGVVGVTGLAPQWFEVDASLFVSDHPFFRFDAEYEALITNRIVLTPAVEVDVPFADDAATGIGAWGPKLEVGARLSYDLVDRLLSPYVGVHYERVFGKTADMHRADGEDVDALYLVLGARMLF